MALKWFKLPVCDLCEKPWLPQDDEARQDPRGFDAKQRAAGEPGLRCGKCKRKDWDRDNRPEPASPAEPATFTGCGAETDNPEVSDAPMKAATAAAKMIRCRCIHGLYTCPQCNPKEG